MWWNTIAVNQKPDNSNVHEKSLTDSEDYITEEDVKFVAESSLGSNIQVIDYQKTKIVPNLKLGFLGVYRHLNITVQRHENSEKEMYSYFLKAITYYEESQTSFINDGKFFYKESNFYRYIVPELLKSSEDKSFIPYCYLIKKDVLVLENLTMKNFHVKDTFLDAISLKSALSSLAKLHAASIMAENRLGKTFIDLYPDIFEERLFAKTGKSFEWFVTSVKALTAVAKSLGLNDEYVSKVCDRVFELVIPSTVRQNVVCHGDIKAVNLMFDDSKPMPNCTLVDFQVLRYVPPMADVAQLIYLNCTWELRKNLEKDLLKHYHNVFSCALQQGNLKEKIPLYNDILEEYQELQLIGLVTNALFTTMIHMEGQKCEELTEDSNSFDRLFFKDRDELILKFMQNDTNYKGKLSKIILEINERASEFLKA